jgi:hypothetical protein
LLSNLLDGIHVPDPAKGRTAPDLNPWNQPGSLVRGARTNTEKRRITDF